MFPASLHVVWALTKFTWLEKEERTLEVFLIFASWYLGAIIGNLCGGLIVPIWPKRPIYVGIFDYLIENIMRTDTYLNTINFRRWELL